MEKRLLTLCIIYKDGKVLLGLKKTGFGSGRWNGFGGKVEKGETVEEAAKRELKEESNIEALEISKRGILNFEFQDNPEKLEVHLFYVDKFSGVPEETKEMKPQWYSYSELPFKNMWINDVHWLPKVIKGEKLKATFTFNQDGSQIIKQSIGVL